MKPVDKSIVSIIQHRLESIVEAMGEAMLGKACSRPMNFSTDFSSAIFDGEGRLALLAEQVLLRVGAMPLAVKAVREFFDGCIKPGDVYLLNDPYQGGSHLQDLTILVPVFADSIEEPVFWTLNCVRQGGTGGSICGSCDPAATDIYQKGLRIPPLKLYDAGELRDDLLHMIATNFRNAEKFRGDLKVIIQSARAAEQHLQRLIAEYDLAAVQDSVNEIMDASERQSRASISECVDGVYTEESFLHDAPGNVNIRLRSIVTKKGDSIHVDLTECGSQAKGLINSSYANTVSAIQRALAFLIDPATPKNEGAFRPISLTTKPGTIAYPLESAPVTFSGNHASQEICGSVIKALSGAWPSAGKYGDSFLRDPVARAANLENGLLPSDGIHLSENIFQIKCKEIEL